MDRGLYLLALGFATAFLTGCGSVPPRPQPLDRQGGPRSASGAGGIEVTIRKGVMSTELERRHEADQLVAAAEAALRSRGFTIDGGRGRLEEPLMVSGVMGGAPDSRRVEVAMLIGPTRVRFDVAIKPWGNDAESRAVMKRMLELLGYERG